MSYLKAWCIGFVGGMVAGAAAVWREPEDAVDRAMRREIERWARG